MRHINKRRTGIETKGTCEKKWMCEIIKRKMIFFFKYELILILSLFIVFEDKEAFKFEIQTLYFDHHYFNNTRKKKNGDS